MQEPLKLVGLHPNLIKSFKTFEDFYKWADPRYSGAKKEFEELYYQYHDRPKKSE
jgi:hypothetical protein